MLNKKDLKDIKKLMQNSLTEFFETLILPYFEQNEKDHAEIRATLKSHDKRFDDHDKRFDSHDKRFDSHDKNFDTQDKDLDSIQRKLEKNEDDHEEMLERLGKVERSSAKIPSKN